VNYTDPSGLTRKGRCKRARRLPRDAWDDPEFEIPGWADTVMGWIGAMSSLLGEYFGWGTRIGSGLMSFAAVLTPATWIVAVEGAQQTGDQLGEVLYTERFEAMDQAIEQQLR